MRFRCKRVPHQGGVNRVRVMPQRPGVVAAWGDSGVVSVYDCFLELYAQNKKNASEAAADLSSPDSPVHGLSSLPCSKPRGGDGIADPFSAPAPQAPPAWYFGTYEECQDPPSVPPPADPPRFNNRWRKAAPPVPAHYPPKGPPSKLLPPPTADLAASPSPPKFKPPPPMHGEEYALAACPLTGWVATLMVEHRRAPAEHHNRMMPPESDPPSPNKKHNRLSALRFRLLKRWWCRSRKKRRRLLAMRFRLLSSSLAGER